MASYCPLGGDKDLPFKAVFCVCFFSVQELTEGSNTVGSPGEGEDRVDESVSESQSTNEQAALKMEQVEAKQEVAAALPARRASASTPSNLPVRLLTRLGSLDGEFKAEGMLRRTLLRWFTTLFLFPGALPVPLKKSPATLPRNFTLPKDPHSSLLRGRISTPPISGSPHLGTLHSHLPPSCIIEELHRALATKHRQERWDTRRDNDIFIFILSLVNNTVFRFQSLQLYSKIKLHTTFVIF